MAPSTPARQTWNRNSHTRIGVSRRCSDHSSPGPSKNPLIILQADEGPYRQRQSDDLDGFQWADATDDELVTKFGVLMAILMPGP